MYINLKLNKKQDIDKWFWYDVFVRTWVDKITFPKRQERGGTQ